MKKVTINASTGDWINVDLNYLSFSLVFCCLKCTTTTTPQYDTTISNDIERRAEIGCAQKKTNLGSSQYVCLFAVYINHITRYERSFDARAIYRRVLSNMKGTQSTIKATTKTRWFLFLYAIFIARGLSLLWCMHARSTFVGHKKQRVKLMRTQSISGL